MNKTIDVFRHFNGGKEGIQQRFGTKIQDAIGKINGLEAAQLAGFVGLNAGELTRIAKGDFTVIKRPLIEALVDPLNLKIEDCLGEIINFNDKKDVDEWTEYAKQQEFISIGGATAGSWTPQQRINLFVVFQALESL
jgi:hypothetical protein